MKQNLGELMTDLVDVLLTTENLKSIEDSGNNVSCTIDRVSSNSYTSDTTFEFFVKIVEAEDKSSHKHDALVNIVFYNDYEYNNDIICYSALVRYNIKSEYNDVTSVDIIRQIINDINTIINRAISACNITDNHCKDLLNTDLFSTDIISEIAVDYDISVCNKFYKYELILGDR